MQQSLFSQPSLFGAAPADESSSAPSLETILDTPLEEAVFTVYDLETTGLSAKKNAITELTAIQFKNGEEVGKLSTLVRPTEVIPAEIEQFTGITNDMVKDAPPLLSVMNEFIGFIGPIPLLVGHNVSFDIGFVREKLNECALFGHTAKIDPSRAFCTKVLAQRALPGLPSYEGIVVATQCGIHNPNPHRAEYDVRMSAGILYALIDRIRAAGTPLRTVRDLLAYQGPIDKSR
jgi:DNA polymerase III epsilon subunit family exonuclease